MDIKSKRMFINTIGKVPHEEIFRKMVGRWQKRTWRYSAYKYC